MRPNLPFLSATSNALLKPGGLLRWKVRLMKDARLLQPLTVMQIARLKSPPLDAPRQSSPRPRQTWQTTYSSLSPKSNPKSVHSLLRSIAGSPPSSSSFPNFTNYSSPRNGLWSMSLTCGPTFLFLSQRLCVPEPEATSLSSTKPRARRSFTPPFALLSPPLNFLQLPLISPRPLPLAQTKLPIPF